MKLSLKNQLRKVVQNRAIEIANVVYNIATNASPNPSLNNTPVWSGSFLASWKMNIGSPASGYYLNKPFDPSEDAPLSRANPPKLTYSGYDLTPIYVSNRVPYAGEINLEGTKYSDPFILQRIVESFQWGVPVGTVYSTKINNKLLWDL